MNPGMSDVSNRMLNAKQEAIALLSLTPSYLDFCRGDAQIRSQGVCVASEDTGVAKQNEKFYLDFFPPSIMKRGELQKF